VPIVDFNLLPTVNSSNILKKLHIKLADVRYHEGLPIQVAEQVSSETQHANLSFCIMVLEV
jgi:hypothetical protein